MNLERIRKESRLFLRSGMDYYLREDIGFPIDSYNREDALKILKWLEPKGIRDPGSVFLLNVVPCRESFEALLLLTEELL